MSWPAAPTQAGTPLANGAAAPAVQDLILARAPRRPYTRVLPLSEARRFATAVFGAWLAGYTLDRIEDAEGCEVYVATRGAATLRFLGVAQVDAWIDQQTALRAAWAGAGA
jgi:hypothetical protein